MTKTFIDITGLLYWYGSPVGIVRCQERYALYARRHLPDAVFTAFDPDLLCYRTIQDDEVDAVIAGKVKIYSGTVSLPGDVKKRFVNRLPRSLRGVFFWTTRFRRMLLLAIEQKRIAAPQRATRAGWAALQEKLTTPKYDRMFRLSDGHRIDVWTLDRLAGPPIAPAPGDRIVAMQFDWTLTDIAAVLALCRRTGATYVALCHDIIPIKFPEWFARHDVESFRRHFDRVFAGADLCIFTTRRTAEDARSYCSTINIALPDHRVVPLGADTIDAADGGARLPSPLKPGQYALFVSTIEPRKNHRMLANVWRRLAREGVTGEVKLVFVGRNGWMMGDFPQTLATDPVLSKAVVHLEGIDDRVLGALYRDAAFCLYPPIYEGFGLPPIEALGHGKALLASSGGPIPEVVGDFAVCLDPLDDDAWYQRLRDWLTGSDEPRRLAERAAREFRVVTWEESARRFFEAVDEARPASLSDGSRL